MRSGPIGTSHMFSWGHRQSFQPSNTWLRAGMQSVPQTTRDQSPYRFPEMLRARSFELGEQPRGAVGTSPCHRARFRNAGRVGSGRGPNPTWLCGQWLAAARVAARRGGRADRAHAGPRPGSEPAVWAAVLVPAAAAAA